MKKMILTVLIAILALSNVVLAEGTVKTELEGSIATPLLESAESKKEEKTSVESENIENKSDDEAESIKLSEDDLGIAKSVTEEVKETEVNYFLILLFFGVVLVLCYGYFKKT